MKKRLLSFVTALVMIAGFCIPASAAGINPEALELIPVEDINTAPKVMVIDNDMSDKGLVGTEAMPSSEEIENEEGIAYAIRDYVSPKEIHIRPIVGNLETHEAFVINNIVRSKYWSSSSQFEALYLSPSQVSQLEYEISTGLANDPSTSGYTWAILGWQINSIINLTATLPQRVEYKQSFIQSPEKYETKVLTVNQQSVNLNVTGMFLLPEGLNPHNYYNMGFDGTFYYRYASGPNMNKETGIPFSCSVSMNSNNG